MNCKQSKIVPGFVYIFSKMGDGAARLRTAQLGTAALRSKRKQKARSRHFGTKLIKATKSFSSMYTNGCLCTQTDEDKC